jgi:transposase
MWGDLDVSKEMAEQLTEQVREHLKQATVLLSRIRDEKLYVELGYGSFSAYIAGEFAGEFSRATVYRWFKQAEKEALLVRENERMSQNAAAELNKQPEALQVVIAKTAAQRCNGNQITARDVRVVSEVVGQMVATGHVDPGTGEMSAVEGALLQEEAERILRQRQHIADGSKWKTVYTTKICNFGGGIEWPSELYFKDVKIIVQEMVVD